MGRESARDRPYVETGVRKENGKGYAPNYRSAGDKHGYPRHVPTERLGFSHGGDERKKPA